jgi:hypothetical protein
MVLQLMLYKHLGLLEDKRRYSASSNEIRDRQVRRAHIIRLSKGLAVNWNSSAASDIIPGIQRSTKQGCDY